MFAPAGIADRTAGGDLWLIAAVSHHPGGGRPGDGLAAPAMSAAHTLAAALDAWMAGAEPGERSRRAHPDARGTGSPMRSSLVVGIVQDMQGAAE